jgi:hypothetical protein
MKILIYRDHIALQQELQNNQNTTTPHLRHG